MKRRIVYNQENKKGLKISGLLVPAVVALGLVSVFFSVRASTVGAVLSSLENEKEELLKINSQLEAQVNSSSSLTKYSSEAEDMGFLKPSEVFYLSSDNEVARLP